MTCWWRLHDWNAAGVWEQLHQAMLTRLRGHDQIDWSRASIDGSSVPSPQGPGNGSQPNGQRQARLQATHRCRCQRHSSGDLVQRCEQARKRPAKMNADKGYDFKRCRAHLRQRRIIGRIARRGIESSERLGKHQWVVESTHSWFAGFGKLRIRFERRLDIREALLKLAAAIICARFVDRWC